MCAGYADALSDDPKMFDRLIYIQRNWETDRQYGKRPKSEFYGLVCNSNLTMQLFTCTLIEGIAIMGKMKLIAFENKKVF